MADPQTRRLDEKALRDASTAYVAHIHATGKHDLALAEAVRVYLAAASPAPPVTAEDIALVQAALDGANIWFTKPMLRRILSALREGQPTDTCEGCGSARIAAITAVIQGKVACCPDCSTLTTGERNTIRSVLDASREGQRGGDVEPLARAIAEINGLINDSDGLRGLNATDTDSWEDLRAEGCLTFFDRALDILWAREEAAMSRPSDTG
jgi:hypothetical protein